LPVSFYSVTPAGYQRRRTIHATYTASTTTISTTRGDERQRFARACNHLRAPLLHRLCARLKFFGALLTLLHQREWFALQRERFRLPLELALLTVADFLQQRNDSSDVCFGHGTV